MTAPAQYKWFFETTTPVEGHMHAIARTIVTRQTKFQFMEIMETHSYGKCLVLDGRIQSSQADEFIYHEMLAHVPILAVKAAKGRVDKVLIVGGGDGGCIREVLKHPKLVCTMVEIDPGVIELSRKHLPNHHAGAFDNPRAKIVIADGASFKGNVDMDV